MQPPTPRPTPELVSFTKQLLAESREMFIYAQKFALAVEFQAATGIAFGEAFFYAEDGGDKIPSVTSFIEKRDKVQLVRRRIGKDGKPSESFAVLIDSWYQYCQPMPAQPPSTQLTL